MLQELFNWLIEACEKGLQDQQLLAAPVNMYLGPNPTLPDVQPYYGPQCSVGDYFNPQNPSLPGAPTKEALSDNNANTLSLSFATNGAQPQQGNANIHLNQDRTAPTLSSNTIRNTSVALSSEIIGLIPLQALVSYLICPPADPSVNVTYHMDPTPSKFDNSMFTEIQVSPAPLAPQLFDTLDSGGQSPALLSKNNRLSPTSTPRPFDHTATINSTGNADKQSAPADKLEKNKKEKKRNKKKSVYDDNIESMPSSPAPSKKAVALPSKTTATVDELHKPKKKANYFHASTLMAREKEISTEVEAKMKRENLPDTRRIALRAKMVHKAWEQLTEEERDAYNLRAITAAAAPKPTR